MNDYAGWGAFGAFVVSGLALWRAFSRESTTDMVMLKILEMKVEILDRIEKLDAKYATAKTVEEKFQQYDQRLTRLERENRTRIPVE